MIKNLIFDFDGTLADTFNLILASMQAAVKDMNLPPKEVDEYRKMVGIRLEDMPAILWPDMEVDKQEYVDTYRKNFEVLKDKYKVTLFPEVKETLKKLHDTGLRMAIATSRSVDSLRRFLEEFGIAGYFDMLVGGESVKNGKPSPDPVLLILNTMGWNAEETMVIGDMNVDILMGTGAGCHTAGVTYGNGTHESLTKVNADYIVNKPNELIQVLL